MAHLGRSDTKWTQGWAVTLYGTSGDSMDAALGRAAPCVGTAGPVNRHGPCANQNGQMSTENTSFINVVGKVCWAAGGQNAPLLLLLHVSQHWVVLSKKKKSDD